jgi:anti-sigma regulatory factor (Ser/Thr protein kinase)
MEDAVPSNCASDIRLEVRSDPRLLASVRGLVREWLASHEVAPQRVDELVLAVDEACANAIRHAYHGRSDELVELHLRATADELMVEVCDRGVTAPPERVDRRVLLPPRPEEVCPGGLGVQLIHQAFDEVRFCPGSPCGNRVTMRLSRKG